MNDESTMKCEFPASIEIEIFEKVENAEPSIESTPQGIVIDLRAKEANAGDSMRLSRESFSNELDESDLQSKQYDEKRTTILKRIVTSSSQAKYRIKSNVMNQQ
jgi:hypothetical protein